MRVYNIHHLHNANIGDRQCTPFAYFPALRAAFEWRDLDTTDPLVGRLRGETVVLGGGGMLHPWPWNHVVEPLLKRHNTVIAWGIGHHHDGVHTYRAKVMADWQGSEARIAEEYPLHRLALPGLRDALPGFPHVPCVTCMHPALDSNEAPRHDLVIYEHGALEPIAIDGPPKLKNTGAHSFEDVLAHLRSGETVITNSFHGTYWAQLLGRRVLVYEPWCTKFWLMNPRPVFCDRANWRERIAEARPTPGLLETCRAANRRFAEDVAALLQREEAGRRGLRGLARDLRLALQR